MTRGVNGQPAERAFSACERPINVSRADLALTTDNCLDLSKGAKDSIEKLFHFAKENHKQIQFVAPGQEPDYILNKNGKLVKNDKAPSRSDDHTVTIGLQTEDRYKKSLADAIKNETRLQKLAAQEMVRLFNEAHKFDKDGPPKVPAWMLALLNAEPSYLTGQATAGTDHRVDDPQVAPPEYPIEREYTRAAPGAERYAYNAPYTGGFEGNGYTPEGYGVPRNMRGFNEYGYFQPSSSERPNLYTGGDWSGYARRAEPMGEGETVAASVIYGALKTHRFSDGFVMDDATCSAILGNMQTECHFQTAQRYDREGAIGLCQWEKERKPEFLAFAATYPQYLQTREGADDFKHHLKDSLSPGEKDGIYKQVVADINNHIDNKHEPAWTNKYVQLAFMFRELETTHREALAQLELGQKNPSTDNPSHQAWVFQHFYEGSADWNLADRQTNAHNLYGDIKAGRLGPNHA
jgi:hypothetical protein